MPQKTQHSFISSNPKKGQHISGQDTTHLSFCNFQYSFFNHSLLLLIIQMPVLSEPLRSNILSCFNFSMFR